METSASSITLASSAYAVIIGVGKYKDSRISVLKYTHADAKAIYDVVIDKRRLGIPKENVRLLLDEDATLQNIKSTVGTWLPQKAGEESTVLFFFSGHGGMEPDQSGAPTTYLIPWDALADDLFATAISTSDFSVLQQRIKSKRLVMFMDACHSGGVISREGTKSVGIINLAKDITAGSGRVMIAASQAKQLSWEDDKLGHGIFAYHLLEALKGQADADRDGKITVTEAFNYLAREVAKTSREFTGSIQEPTMESHLNQDIVLVIDPGRLEEINKQQENLENKKKAEKEKLFVLFSKRNINAKQYAKVSKVYDTDDALLDENDRKVKRLSEEFLAGRLPLKDFTSTIDEFLKVIRDKENQAIRQRAAAERLAVKKVAADQKALGEKGPKRRAVAERLAAQKAPAFHSFLMELMSQIIRPLVTIVFIVAMYLAYVLWGPQLIPWIIEKFNNTTSEISQQISTSPDNVPPPAVDEVTPVP